MENVGDVINSVKATLYERISNPLLSSFFISWSIWNYKFILVFFSSSMSTLEKIGYIHTSLFPFSWSPFISSNNAWSITFLLLGPLVTTTLYLYIIYPKLGKKVYEDHKEHIRQYEEIKVKIEGKTSMSEDDVVALKSELRTIRGIHSKQLDDKDNAIDILKHDLDKVTEDAATSRNQLSSIQGQQNDIDNLKADLIKERKMSGEKEELLQQLKTDREALSAELNLLKNNNEQTKNNLYATATAKLNQDASDLLKTLSYDPASMFLNILRKNTSIHRLRFDNAINSLIEGKYVETVKDINGNEKISIKSKGEKYLVDNKLV